MESKFDPDIEKITLFEMIAINTDYMARIAAKEMDQSCYLSGETNMDVAVRLDLLLRRRLRWVERLKTPQPA